MNAKFVTVIKREYLSRVRTKGFAIFTVLIPALLAGYLYTVIHIANSGANVQTRLAIVDQSGGPLAPALVDMLQDKLPDGRPRYVVTVETAGASTVSAVAAKLRGQVEAGTLDGFVVLPPDVLQSRHAEYHTRNAANLAALDILRSRLESAVTRVQLAASGVPPAQIAHAFGEFKLDQLKVGPEGEHEDRGETLAVAYLLTVMLYITTLFYGMNVMRSVTEEKVSRVSEILLASVDSFSLMLGKILGVAAAGLTQYLIWSVCAAAGLSYFAALALASGVSLPHVGAFVYFVFVAFFLLGFLVYASIYAAVGAMVSNDQEAQQTVMPITLLLVVAFVMAMSVVNNPNSTASVVLSMIPFFAPILMFMRVATANPPLWQVFTSMAICVATLLALAKVTAKVYRIGILMTGKRPTLPELLKWLRYA